MHKDRDLVIDHLLVGDIFRGGSRNTKRGGGGGGGTEVWRNFG